MESKNNTGVNYLRKAFLDFFESKGHLSRSSYSLIPHNDKSLLLINAGMTPLKAYFTGQETPPRTRMATCQKCIRTGDIENVGKTQRHLTFFEMLGNFSFGDYFKKEAIDWTWEFLTEVMGLEADRLYPSIYGEDEEAFEIWTKNIGVPAEKITRFYRDPETGECDNFWEHGAGPCGPCSEVYYDRGEKYGCGKPTCKVGCDCDRYMEVWNNVFTQFNGDGKGNYEELENKNIDTGMGLERLAVVMQDVDSVFDIDTMKGIRDKICEITGHTYGVNEKADVSIRLITDHIRSATFMICDGILPSNEGRGYVLRRLIRRAARHFRLLGVHDNDVLSNLAKTVIIINDDGYPELVEKEKFIKEVLSEEEKKFSKTIDQGLNILTEHIAKLKQENKKVLSGEDTFRLYDTFGFPLDLTIEILEEQGFSVDTEGFEKCMEEQKVKARSARKTSNYMGADVTVYEELSSDITTEFTGYDTLESESEIVVLTEAKDDGDAFADHLNEGEFGTIITGKTPFYATKGGQQNDIGTIETHAGVFVVEDVVTLVGERVGHRGYVKSGVIIKDKKATLKVNPERRGATAKNHSATHLLHKALKMVLGDHVTQAGSDVNEHRLRFDFTHFSAMTDEQIQKVQDIVNEEILLSLPVNTEIMKLDEAKASGAEAHFDEKYGQEVRVVSMGDFSKEFCGGTHVKNTMEIASFKIISENGISSGVRRIEALTGMSVFMYYNNLEQRFNELAEIAKTSPHTLKDKLVSMMAEINALQTELESLKAKSAKDSMGDIAGATTDIKGVSYIGMKVAGADTNTLRDLGDELKSQNPNSVILLASESEGKVLLMATATDAAIKQGAHAGNIIKAVAGLVGGGGGGRPNMAQAGGKNPAGIDDALAAAKAFLEENIK